MEALESKRMLAKSIQKTLKAIIVLILKVWATNYYKSGYCFCSPWGRG